MADTPAQVALDEREETPAEEFSRLIIEFNEGERQNRSEAWNLIADFACEHSDAIIRALSSGEAGDDGQGALVERPRLLDLSNLLKHAFISGRESASGCGSFNAEAWVAYDPEQCPAYGRISSALSDYAALRADKERVEREKADFIELAGKAQRDFQRAAARAAIAERRLAEQVLPRRITRTDILREWFGGDRYARDYEYLDANYGEQADRVVAYLSVEQGQAQGEAPMTEFQYNGEGYSFTDRATPPSPEPDVELVEALEAAYDRLDPSDERPELMEQIEQILRRHRKQGGA